jgi:hypothetical protein
MICCFTAIGSNTFCLNMSATTVFLTSTLPYAYHYN